MTPVRRRWSIYVAILLVAFGARLVAAHWWQSRLPADQRFAFGDSYSYWVLATRLAHGESFQFGEHGQIFRTPGYPAMLALLFLGNGGEPTSVLVARYFGAAWGVATVAATIELARRLTSETTGLVAGAIVAIQPEAIASSVFVLSEATFCLPMLVQLICWLEAWRSVRDERSWANLCGWSIAGGLTAAAATMMRPGWLLFVPWSLAMLLILRWRPTGNVVREGVVGGVMLASLTVGMLPWWWRNDQVSGEFVATTLQAGASLYDGLSPQAQGGSDMRFVPEFIAQQQTDDARQTTPPVGLFEARLDRRLRDASLAWVREQPRRAAELALIKFVRLWNLWPNAQDLGSPLARLAITAGYVPLVILAGIATWRNLSRSPQLILCLLPAGYLTALHVVFVSSIRYRQPAIFLLAILAALCVCQGWQGRRT